MVLGVLLSHDGEREGQDLVQVESTVMFCKLLAMACG